MTPTTEITSCGVRYRIVDLRRLDLGRLPWVHRILIENLVRHGEDVDGLAEWIGQRRSAAEIIFWPGRVMMHDTTCGPALVDLAAARSVLAEQGRDPTALNPVLPVDVSTDHSLAVDVYGSPDARTRNMAREMERNAERYSFMKWAANALDDFAVHPPGTGIMHTINLERLATVVRQEERDGVLWAVPDTLIGTDSHTPMVNGIGVLGWGVGGLEAESVMLGQPIMMRVPSVVGVRLTGRLGEGVTSTDLALMVTHRLRQLDLSGRFVEYFGPGVATLSAGDRSVVANMAPEYGSSTGYFPIDDATLAYLRDTGRVPEAVALVEDYARATGLWFDPEAEPAYDETIEIDLSAVAMSLAGPRRPQDLVSPADVPALVGGGHVAGNGLPARPVVLGAITSCTNTTDPRLLVAAGLVARKARTLGLKPPPWVKTSFAPGSPTAERMLARAGLLDALEDIGFAITGYGCTVCIGNSGPLPDFVERAIANGTAPVSVLSGNRNFPGRVHPLIDDSFLASPPLVVVFALAGDAAIDITRDPIARAPDGSPVRLVDLWPTGAEIDAVIAGAATASDFAPAYAEAEASAAWATLPAADAALYPWDDRSTYLRRPPFVRAEAECRLGQYEATPILVLGDDITTDHISPAGAIPPSSDAGKWLIERGENPQDLNVYSSRRGNWEVMLRGLFTNRSVVNLLAPDIAPGWTVLAGTGEHLPLWRAAGRYAEEGRSVVVVAGDRYGTGSSRDWAAKGVALLGARAVLATGFERIHRSNLVNMGILPLRLPAGCHPEALKLGPRDRIEIDARSLAPRSAIPVTIHYHDGRITRFEAMAEVETRREATVLERGGILPLVLNPSEETASTFLSTPRTSA
ncbi:aconitate hydratase AcnA [Nostoc sp. 3335mG]|nr:aconitate hydratase AcnA [Nostoc sp. 3335mG]